MNSQIAVAVGLAAVFAAVLAQVSALTPAFAAEASADITPGSSSKTTDAFAPNPININVGDTVTWTNKDSQPHTVTSGSGGQPDGKFDSSPNFNPLLVPQGTFKHTFEEAGEFPYYCGLHPAMVGTVVVAGGPVGPKEFSITAKDSGKDYQITGKSEDTEATSATINAGESVQVQFEGAGEVELTLPKSMISDINAIMAGTNEVTFTSVSENADSTTISFEVPEGQTTVNIMGGFVVPEFPVIAAILAATIAAIIGYSRFAKSGTGFFGRA